MFIRRDENICGGVIGSGSRVCIKQCEEGHSNCGVQSHKKKRVLIADNLYIRGKGDSVFAEPTAPLSVVPERAREAFVQCSRVYDDWLTIYSVIGAGLKDPANFAKLEKLIGKVKVTTPVKPELEMRTDFSYENQVTVELLAEWSDGGIPQSFIDLVTEIDVHLQDTNDAVCALQEGQGSFRGSVVEDLQRLSGAVGRLERKLGKYIEIDGTVFPDVKSALQYLAESGRDQVRGGAEHRLSQLELGLTKLRDDVQRLGGEIGSAADVKAEVERLGSEVDQLPLMGRVLSWIKPAIERWYDHVPEDFVKMVDLKRLVGEVLVGRDASANAPPRGLVREHPFLACSG